MGSIGGSAAVRTGRTGGWLQRVRASVICPKKDMAGTLGMTLALQSCGNRDENIRAKDAQACCMNDHLPVQATETLLSLPEENRIDPNMLIIRAKMSKVARCEQTPDMVNEGQAKLNAAEQLERLDCGQERGSKGSREAACSGTIYVKTSPPMLVV